MNAQAALVQDRYGRPIMAGFHGLWSVATLTGAALGGVLVGAGLAVPLHFLAVVVIALPGIVLAGRGLLDTPAPAQAAAGAAAWALLPRALWPLGALAFSVLLCEGAVGDWSAVYLRDGLAGAPAAVGERLRGFLPPMVRAADGRLADGACGAGADCARAACWVVAGIATLLVAGTPPVAVLGFALIGAGVAVRFPW